MDIEQRQFDRPAYASATVAPFGANTVSVAITVRNVNGKPVGPTMLALYLAGAANGEQLSAVAPSGAFGCAQPGVLGNDIAVLQAGKVLLIQTMADGRYTLSLTDAAKGSFRVTVMIGEVAQLVLTTLSGFYG